MQTRDQIYAAKIFAQVSEIEQKWPKKTKHESKRKQYGSMAHKLPVLIRTAGLTQALEFVAARGKPAHHDLLDHLAKTVLGENHDGQVLRERSRTTTQLSEYMRLTQETLAALLWYKRFAQSVLEVDASEARDDQEDGESAEGEQPAEGGDNEHT